MNGNEYKKLSDAELEELKNSIELHEKQLENVEKEYELKKKLFEISDEQPQIIEPKYKYEENPEYWAVFKELLKTLHSQELVGIESQIQHLEHVIDEKKKQLMLNEGDGNGE